MGEHANYRFAYFFGNQADCLKIARRGYRKSCFNDINFELLKLPGDFEFLDDVQRPAGCLFSISKSGVKKDYLVLFPCVLILP
jgi:hypothetical protein